MFVSNEAENGGGVSLEKSAKLHGISAGNSHINFVMNRATHYGGALYVDDVTNPDMCTAVSIQSSTPSTKCFSNLIQSLSTCHTILQVYQDPFFLVDS